LNLYFWGIFLPVLSIGFVYSKFCAIFVVTNNNPKMSIQLGKFNTLEVVKEVDFGFYLDGGEEGEILLPTRYVPDECKVGDQLKVFLYLDSEERLIATTLTPLVQVGEFACLEVSWVNEFGAFLNWGLMKDLFVPFSEQKMKMLVGKSYVIYCYIDEQTFRLVATAKIDRWLSKEIPDYQPEQQVEILIWQKTDLGFKAIIENKFSGLVYESEVFGNVHTGDRMTAYVKSVRPDGKIDLILQKPGFEKVDNFAETLLHYINEHNGEINVNDKSSAELIYNTFGVSKKTFKKAVGELYKRRLILLQEDRISSVK
jgi:predicted RNA-binding protein (virulence factor B family)